MATMHLDDPTGYGRVVRDAQGRVQRVVETKAEGDATADSCRSTRSTARSSRSTRTPSDKRSTASPPTTPAGALSPRCPARATTIRPRNSRARPRRPRPRPRRQRPRPARTGPCHRPAAHPRRSRPRRRDDRRPRVDPHRRHRHDRPRHHDRAELIPPRRDEHRRRLHRRPPHDPHRRDPARPRQDPALLRRQRRDRRRRHRRPVRLPATRHAPTKGSKAGTFVEIKNSDVGANSKVPHLSYIGDADIGEDTNIGAATITANYDGTHKHRTTIGKRVHTGVDTTLSRPSPSATTLDGRELGDHEGRPGQGARHRTRAADELRGLCGPQARQRRLGKRTGTRKRRTAD